VNDADMATMPIGLQMFSGERGTDWGPLMAAVTLVAIPSLLIVVLLQKQLQQGVSMGGFGGRSAGRRRSRPPIGPVFCCPVLHEPPEKERPCHARPREVESPPEATARLVP